MHSYLKQVLCISLLLVISICIATPLRLLARDQSTIPIINLNTVKEKPQPDEDSEAQINLLIKNKINKMSIKDKVGQLFILGYHGSKFSGHLKKRINKFNPGSIIVYKRNIKSLGQIRKFNFALQKHYNKKNGFPMFIMTDQEGGAVSRIKHRFTPPSALSVGQTNQPIFAKDYGLITGEIMNLLGFNFNLAPVADLSNPYKKNFIGNRSFGNDPKKVLNFSQQFAQGLIEASIIPTFKHYPGHGGTVNDSHRKLPKKLDTFNELKDSHFYPFKQIAKFKTPSAIMTAHISFPNIDHSGVPATYSKMLITDILRNKFKYNGLIITDDLRMAGASSDNHEHVGKRALDAFLAGCDMMMLAWGYKKQDFAKRFLVKAVKNNKISQERLNNSLRRILYYKYKYSTQILPSPIANKKLRMAFKELKILSNKISHKNFEASLNQQKKNLKKLPNDSFYKNSKTISVFSAYKSFYKNLKFNSKLKYSFYKLHPKTGTPINQILSSDSNLLGIFYVSGVGTSRLLNQLNLEAKKKLLIVNTTYPGIIEQPHQYFEVINMNTQNSLSGKWMGKQVLKPLRDLASDENQN